MYFVFNLLRTSADGNCLFNACSLALVGDESLAVYLRCITSIELYSNVDFYASHPLILSLNTGGVFRNPEHLFHLAMSFDAAEFYKEGLTSAILAEAKLNANNYNFSSFICILGLSSALKQKIECFCPIETTTNGSHSASEVLFNQSVYPREGFIPRKEVIYIFFCASTNIDFINTGKCIQRKNHFVPLLPSDYIGQASQSSKPPLKTKRSIKSLSLPAYLFSDQPSAKKSKLCFVENTGDTTPISRKKQKLIGQFFHKTDQNKDLQEARSRTSTNFSTEICNPSFTEQYTSKYFETHTETFISTKDIGNVYKSANSVSDSTKYALLCSIWKPNHEYTFPGNSSGRKFQWRWLEEFKWLSYSAVLDGAFCLSCVFFGRESTHNASKLSCLFKEPLKNWGTALRRFRNHALKSPIHSTAILRHTQFVACMENRAISIKMQCDSSIAKQVELNRKKLDPIVQAVILCGRQNIPLRGHRDDSSFYSDPNNNSGNLQAILTYLAMCGENRLFEDHIRNAKKSATYRSKTTQNEVIGICKRLVIKSIVREVKNAKFFSVLADEAADVSKVQQIALVIRFVDQLSEIRESFLGFFPCSEGLTGRAIAKQIVGAVSDVGLDMSLCRGQGYDGAGNMAGKLNGASAIIRNEFPKALYVHCKSHLLNLCVASTCDLELVRNMMDQVQSTTNFFNFHTTHFALLQQQIEKNLPSARHSHLLDVCRTRWVCRIDALDVFVEVFTAIAVSIQIVKRNADSKWSRAAVKEARSLFSDTVLFEFIISLVTVARMLEVTRPLTKQLQSANIDFIDSIEKITLLFAMLMRMRKEVNIFHNQCYTEAVELAGKIGTVPSRPRTVNIQVYRSNIPASSPSDYYKRNLTIPFLDHLTNEMQKRFSQTNLELLTVFYAMPNVVVRDSSWMQSFMKFLSLYEGDMPEPRHSSIELKTWETKWKMVTETLPTRLNEVLPLTDQLIFPNIYTALKIAATIPVTSCSCERSISVLRRLKTYLRNTMNQTRMNGLALLNVHRDIHINSEEVIDQFARDNPRRMKLLDILS